MVSCAVCNTPKADDGTCPVCESTQGRPAPNAQPPQPAPPRASPWEEATFSRPDEVAQASLEMHLGRYVRLQKLGSGSFGEVWRSWDKVFERWVAVKLLKEVNTEEVR